MKTQTNTFQKDLEFGKQYEYKLLDMLDFDEAEIGTLDDYDTDYDIKILKDDKTTTYEVKTDRVGLKTGNFCIEFEYRNKPSGILISKADFYAIYLIDRSIEELFIIPLGVLKDALNTKLFREIKTGYLNRSTCLLIPINNFQKYRVN